MPRGEAGSSRSSGCSTSSGRSPLASSAGRLPKRYLLSFIYFSRTIAITWFVLMPVTPWSAMIFGGAMGLFWLSTVPLTSGLVALMFGTRYMATLFGFAFFSHQVGSFLGVCLGGYPLRAHRFI